MKRNKLLVINNSDLEMSYYLGALIDSPTLWIYKINDLLKEVLNPLLGNNVSETINNLYYNSFINMDRYHNLFMHWFVSEFSKFLNKNPDKYDVNNISEMIKSNSYKWAVLSELKFLLEDMFKSDDTDVIVINEFNECIYKGINIESVDTIIIPKNVSYSELERIIVCEIEPYIV